jgi:multicomponent Na+:H+ antiporter subunit D
MSTLVLMVVVPLLNAFLLSVTAVPRTMEHTTLMRIRNLLSISGMTVLSLLLLSCAPTIVSGNSYTYHLGGWSPFLGIALQLDALSFTVASVSVLVCFLALFYSIPHMGYMRRVGKYDAFYFLMVTGIMGVLLTRDLFNMYVFSEILNISIYVLITANEQKESYTASIKYLILGSLSSALFLLSVGLVYKTTGSLNMDYAREGLRILVQENPSLAYLIFSLFFGFLMHILLLHPPFQQCSPVLY